MNFSAKLGTLPGVIVGIRSLPYNLVDEVFPCKEFVEEAPNPANYSGIAMNHKYIALAKDVS